ncbi:MAG: PBP1A family penicillin-binding protein [Syntrophomonadaceae bacterium]|jgi:1A family penicillin-binding protein|nr:PBP1A family penicillin-binding protein [Syntrophomonadaceae bacterium]
MKNRLRFLRAVLIAILVLSSGFSLNLPPVEIPQPSVVYDINGDIIRGISETNTIYLTRDEIPASFVRAIIAVEDKNFYSHYGVDPVGILRAVFVNLKAGKIMAGGSTITQQTAKNLFLTQERTWLRKFKELFYAVQLEREYSKDEILTFYCNSIYFGQGAYGLEAAARTFFACQAMELTLAQSALLAGITNWPSQYDPYINPDKARDRQKLVLNRMMAEKMIDETEYQKALQEELVYQQARFIGGDAPYFIAMVTDYLKRNYDERSIYQDGMQIYTTLDLTMQKAANQAYLQGTKDFPPDLQAVLAAIDPANGYIKALIGGRDFARAPYNRALAERQPGSTFKPFMYSLGIDYGLTQADMFMCQEYEYYLENGDIYKPVDYGDKPFHYRPLTLREAMARSDNVIAVKVNEILGPKAVASYAALFGFKGVKPVLSLPLGSKEVKPLEMAAAYGVFASGGLYSQPVYILSIKDRRGKILEQNQIQQQRVISETTAYIITDMLKAVLQPGGTASQLMTVFDRPAAGKTGTTDDFNDAWFVGYSPDLCCAVWVGYDADRPADLTGGAAAGPIWAVFMQEASRGLPPEDFVKPYNVNIMNICLDSGMIAVEGCKRTNSMAFIKGTEPGGICYLHSNVGEGMMNSELSVPVPEE